MLKSIYLLRQRQALRVAGGCLALTGLVLSGCQNSSSPCSGSEAVSERLFLQQVTSDSAIIKWRGGADSVCLGDSQSRLTRKYTATETAGAHKEVRVRDLEPDTTYYYSIGGAWQAPDGQQFSTAPLEGSTPEDGNTKIWIIGDSGTASELDGDGNPKYPGEAVAVMQGFLDYNAGHGNEPVDLFLMLGDNAYISGTDNEYQAAVFDVYAQLLKGVALWPTIGNHEMGVGTLDIGGGRVFSYGGISMSSDPDSYTDEDDTTTDNGMPYLSIFTLPEQGQVGGVASGTEQYYSFNYGNVHIVSLDSQLTARDDTARALMREWLIQDLSTNTQSWTIVIFHHPPYSKGANHDSDDADTRSLGIDLPQYYMRAEFVPIFDEYGVDLVYSGHAHVYERSYYISHHTGTSATFDPYIHAELNSLGEPASGQGDESYPQVSATSGIDDKAVYTVAGSSGKANPFPGEQHAAHFIGLAETGSVVVDATETTLTARFINAAGSQQDYLVITR